MEEGLAGRSGGVEQNRRPLRGLRTPATAFALPGPACSPTSCGYNKPQERRTLTQGGVRLPGSAGGWGAVRGWEPQKGPLSTCSRREEETSLRVGSCGEAEPLLAQRPGAPSPGGDGEQWSGACGHTGLERRPRVPEMQGVQGEKLRGGDALSPSGCTEVESEQGHPGDSWPRQPGDWREGLRSKGEQRARPPRGPQTEISSSCGGGGWAENETLEPLAAAGEAG